jgi:NAD-dependent deacetylase
MRRREVYDASPNDAHYLIAQLEKDFIVDVITQNVDDLHERAGSTNVLHLHGEIKKARSSNDVYDWAGMSPSQEVNNPKLYDVSYEGLKYGRDFDESGFPLRPAIVWFGESVPRYADAIDIIEDESVDAIVIIGTSLQVYPAASIPYSFNKSKPIFYIDPDPYQLDERTKCFAKSATEGMSELYDYLLENF